ncbi:hypothetical protein [Burkholderia cenocepacia]|uniref:hypothetical protein n=1 Tax=Burkholderia cenocepacia TaxID=95486 RepID=UPI000AD2DE8A|nr:hypothetical protein [Burkholderia cenocepacia]
MSAAFTFSCQLPNGNKNSVSASNTFEAQRRARALGATKLFCHLIASDRSIETTELSIS